jgi:hypothetical protein
MAKEATTRIGSGSAFSSRHSRTGPMTTVRTIAPTTNLPSASVAEAMSGTIWAATPAVAQSTPEAQISMECVEEGGRMGDIPGEI